MSNANTHAACVQPEVVARHTTEFNIKAVRFSEFEEDQVGVVSPLVGVVSLLVGVETPLAGVVSPHVGVMSQHVGVVSKHVGVVSLHVGAHGSDHASHVGDCVQLSGGPGRSNALGIGSGTQTQLEHDCACTQLEHDCACTQLEHDRACTQLEHDCACTHVHTSAHTLTCTCTPLFGTCALHVHGHVALGAAQVSQYPSTASMEARLCVAFVFFYKIWRDLGI